MHLMGRRQELIMIRIFCELRGDLATLAGASGQVVITREFSEPTSIKDALEGLGIPHTEVDLLLRDGQPLDFGFLVFGDERIEVHPVPDSPAAPPIWPDARLQPRPLFCDRFACDQHLGKLARWLRLLGYDTLYSADWCEPDLARIATSEDRAVLTCSRALLKRKCITRGRLIRSRQPESQAIEVVRRFHLFTQTELFGRCTVCNGELMAVDKATVLNRIPSRTRQWLDEYYLCRGCDRLYWEGSHVKDLHRRVQRILTGANSIPR
jgi:uncharacterized protein with PIN domain